MSSIITEPSRLEADAHKTLTLRAAELSASDPKFTFTRGQIGRIFKTEKVRKKVIATKKSPKHPPSQLEREITFAYTRKLLIDQICLKKRIVFTDESVFTWRTTQTRAYSRMN